MADFVDRALAQLCDAGAFATLLKGAPAPTYPKLERLVNEVYPTDAITLDRITDVAVLSVEPARRLSGTSQIALTWQQQQPSYLTADLRGSYDGAAPEIWADLFARVRLDLVAAVEPGGVESALAHAIENITSLDDFRSRFRYLDLDAFLAQRQVTTVEELRASAEYVLAEVHFRPVPPFDPMAPANRHAVTFDVAVAVLGIRDLAEGLRAAQRLRAAGTRPSSAAPDGIFGTPRRAFALAVVLPAGQAPGQPDADAADRLYAAAGVLPLFASPP